MRRVSIALLALAMVATACATDEEPAAEETTTTTEAAATTAAPEAAGAAVTVASSDMGDILVDGEGNTLYLFTPDAQGESVCYDQCEEAWPPLTGDVSAGDGLDESLLGSAARTDGSSQVTYNGWPLYYFAADAAPGDTNGQGVNDVWYVLDSNGDGIGLAAGGAMVQIASSALGDILVDGEGNTLYLFTPDAQGESVCYDQCEEAWPPLTGDVSAGDGLDESLLGSAARTDGSSQVTYNGWPLYYFAADAAPGDTNGQGVNDVWYVLDAAGGGIGLAASVEIVLTDNDLGSILTDADGNTLYLFDPDAQGESVCYDQCETAWPPLVTDAVAGEGIDEALLGSAPRTDGSTQVTYNGWPLYYFANDAAPGDTNGQGLNDVWWVVDAAGDAIK